MSEMDGDQGGPFPSHFLPTSPECILCGFDPDDPARGLCGHSACYTCIPAIRDKWDKKCPYCKKLNAFAYVRPKDGMCHMCFEVDSCRCIPQCPSCKVDLCEPVRGSCGHEICALCYLSQSSPRVCPRCKVPGSFQSAEVPLPISLLPTVGPGPIGRYCRICFLDMGNSITCVRGKCGDYMHARCFSIAREARDGKCGVCLQEFCPVADQPAPASAPSPPRRPAPIVIPDSPERLVPAVVPVPVPVQHVCRFCNAEVKDQCVPGACGHRMHVSCFPLSSEAKTGLCGLCSMQFLWAPPVQPPPPLSAAFVTPECPVCLDDMLNAFVGSLCGHSICGECKDVFDSKKTGPLGKCPYCRQDTDFTANYALRDMLDKNPELKARQAKHVAKRIAKKQSTLPAARVAACKKLHPDFLLQGNLDTLSNDFLICLFDDYLTGKKDWGDVCTALDKASKVSKFGLVDKQSRVFNAIICSDDAIFAMSYTNRFACRMNKKWFLVTAHFKDWVKPPRKRAMRSAQPS